MKATKKPVTIECFKYDGDLMNSDGKFYVPEWAEKAYNDGVIFFKDQGEMYIKTLEGEHHASVGDYIIRGVNGELYPCKPDIFEKTYDIEEGEVINKVLPWLGLFFTIALFIGLCILLYSYINMDVTEVLKCCKEAK